MRIAPAWLATLGLSSVLACEEPGATLYIARCAADEACEAGQVCIDGECVPRDSVSCSAVEGGRAVLQPGPPVLDFGHVGPATSMQSVVLRNIGDCTLTLFEAYLEKEGESPFECPFCTADRFPIELFPFRDHELSVFFTPADVGTFEDNLILLSDDAEFSEIRVPVRSIFNGVPKLTAIPDAVDFDYVPAGRTVRQVIGLENRGTGTAPLVVSKLEIHSSTVTAFEITPLTEPVTLDPRSLSDDELEVEIRYHPRDVATHVAQLLVYTNQPGTSIHRVPLIGSSKTPATIEVAPESIQFGPVPIGQTTARPLTIVNRGGTPLHVSYRWTGTGLSTDLSALPLVVPPVMPGQYTELQVLVTATAPQPIVGLLVLSTNDPAHPTVTVPVSADGQPVAGAQVLKLDMNFDNGSDGVFDDDLRNVDMALESPFGLICDERIPSPTTWGGFGNPTWLAFGPKKEPERIVLPDAMQDGRYRVLLSYVQDCASLPSALLAGVLGISLDVLIAYFTGGVGIGVGGDQIADVIADICFDHASSAATVTVFLNGQVVAEVPVTLGRLGDYRYALDLVRTNGVFTVVP